MATTRLTLRSALRGQATLITGPHRSEHCSVDASTLASLRSRVGRQVRVARNGRLALYTVTEAPEDRRARPVLRTGRDGMRRIASASGQSVRIDTAVTNTRLSEAKAEAASELVERHTGEGRRLAVLAPHGGGIEPYTDQQAKRVEELLGRARVQTWRCLGWKRGGGAHERWHITSSEISEASFPRLRTLSQTRFSHAVAFHGWEETYIGIGGLADRSTRSRVRRAIDDAVPNVRVRLDDSTDSSGNSERNIVNRFASGKGVQVEQPLSVREDHWEAIAAPVAGVFQ